MLKLVLAIAGLAASLKPQPRPATASTRRAFFGVASSIVAQDGIGGLLFRGLGTKLLSNGLQAMLFTVCWRYLEEKLNERAKRKLEEKKAE